MSIARVTEIISFSTKSFGDAVLTGVERANQTLRDVRGAWIKEQAMTVENDKIAEYRVILKVSFVGDENEESTRRLG